MNKYNAFAAFAVLLPVLKLAGVINISWLVAFVPAAAGAAVLGMVIWALKKWSDGGR